MIPDLPPVKWRILALLCRREAESLDRWDDGEAMQISHDLTEIAEAIEKANP